MVMKRYHRLFIGIVVLSLGLALLKSQEAKFEKEERELQEELIEITGGQDLEDFNDEPAAGNGLFIQ